MTPFAKALINWYLRHKRDLPWRQTSDPYRIWLSEIMLQQTRVAQGMPYYFAFTDAFPDVFSLADADEQQVLKLWQGLGYYSRARNLHATAKNVAYDLDGKFPETFDGLTKLKGVGDYTAAAIASISFGQAVPVVDGNVFRVLARHFGIHEDIALPHTKRIFYELAMQQLPTDAPADFNQAIMEFGALQCVPKNPDCGVCPVQKTCVAYSRGIVSELPIKSKKLKPKDRYLNYIVLKDPQGKTSVQKRTGKGIWQHLYEFPVIETSSPANVESLLPELSELGALEIAEPMPQYDVIHKLSHQTLHIRFVSARLKTELESGVDVRQLKEFPFPIVLANFIERHWKAD